MANNHTGLRRMHWLPVRRSPARRSNGQSLAGRPRSLRMESLEQRALLSVTGIGSETFKEFEFTSSGTVASDFETYGYDIHLSGKATLSKGVLTYTGVDNGELTNTAILSGGGSYRATGQTPNFGGSWKIGGATDDLIDTAGVLSGSVVIDSSSMTIPTQPTQNDIFNGTYALSDATFDTTDFSVDMVLTSGDYALTYSGKLYPKGSTFGVGVTPSWNADGSVDVDVDVTGKPHTTTTADRSVPVTNIELYWSKSSSYSSRIGGALPDTIPVYWNEASGSYTVSDLPDAPAGATCLLFVAKYDKRTKVVALPYNASIAAPETSVQEGDGGEAQPNEAVFTVTLPHASDQDVTVWYSTVKGKTDKAAGTLGATPGVDYWDGVVAKKNKEVTGSIVIPAGETEGTISIPVLGDTTFETDETFSVKITKVQNAGLDKVNKQATATIANDDALPTISIANVTQAEGSRGTTRFTFTATLSNPTYQTVYVRYATGDGPDATATPKTDYTAVTTPRLLKISAGQTTKTFTISVKGDREEEPDEWFYVDLSSPVNAAIAGGQAKGTILDDDGAAAARTAAATRDAVLGQLAASFDQLAQRKSDKDLAATDSVLAAL